MTSGLPAWSEAFTPERLRPIRSIRWPATLTREWAFGDGSGRGVRVAVVDSGVDGSHPRVGPLAGGVAVEPDESAADGVRFVAGPHLDLYGHGTACAAIIRGLAPACSLYSVRVLGSSLSGRGRIFAAGLRRAMEQRVDCQPEPEQPQPTRCWRSSTRWSTRRRSPA